MPGHFLYLLISTKFNIPDSLIREPLIKSEVTAIQGCIAIFNDHKSLNMRAKQKSHFCFACSDKSRMDLFRASLAIQFR